MKKAILYILKYPLFINFFLITALKIHNLSYRVAGILSPEIESDRLHPKHRITRYHDWFIKWLKKDWNVLDIGCGNGALAYDMKNSCRSVTGLDILQENITKAQKNYYKEGIEYICADAIDFEYETNFQAIVLSNVLEHIKDRIAFLKKVFAKQDKNSPPVLLLRVPMITRDWITIYKKEIGVEWRLDHTHYTEYTLDQVFDEMNQAGLKVESYDVLFGEFFGVVIKKGSNN